LDIDIDTAITFNPSKIFGWTRASVVKDGHLQPHPCGYYPQNIPKDFATNISAIPYAEAEELGYYKIDFLHLNVYSHFQNRKQLDEMLSKEPDWKLLLIPSEQTKLFQLSKHGETLDIVKPTNIEELADVLALIRPGKKSLLKLYLTNKQATRSLLYAKDENGYSFKKSHALAYAHVIWLQLHLIEQQKI
jgi:DNA polymerase III alpha subunit